MKWLATVALLVAVFLTSVASARFPYPNPTPQVRFTGTLLPLKAQNHGDFFTLTVFIRGQYRLLRLEAVEELTARECDRTIIQELFHRQIRLYGPDDLILSLQQPESVGKLLTIEGRLYPRDRRLLIAAVEEVSPAEAEGG